MRKQNAAINAQMKCTPIAIQMPIAKSATPIVLKWFLN